MGAVSLPVPEAVRRFTPPRVAKPLVWLLALAPLAWVTWAFVSDALQNTRHLGANPIKAAEHFVGNWAINFLLFSLLVTPLRQLLGWNWLQKYRRMLGLFAFFYALVHLLVWAVLDVELDLGDIAEDLTERWYIMIGMAALLTMTPLAVTSTRGWVKRLGKRWTKLHRLIWVVVALAIVHFFMAMKKDVTEPVLYGLAFAALAGYRLWMARRRRAPG